MVITKTKLKTAGLKSYWRGIARLLTTQAQVQLAEESKNGKLRSFNELPGPTYFEMLSSFVPGGSLHDKSIVDFAQEMRKKYGDIFLIPGIFGRPNLLQTFATEDFETIFRNEGQWPIKESLDSVHHFRTQVKNDFFGDLPGLMVQQGESWTKLRTTVNPVLMKPNTMKQYLKPLLGVNRDFIKRIAELRDPETLEVPASFDEELNRMAFESIAVVAINKELGLVRKNRDNPEAVRFLQNARKFFILVYQLDVEPSLWRIIPTPTYYESVRVQTEIFETTKKYVTEALQELEQKQLDGVEVEKFSVLEKLLSINRRMAIVMAMDILLGGVDGTSATLVAILIALSKHPEKQQKLREEILNILPHKDSDLTEENMKSMPYLRAVIKESMRYYPNGPGSFRTSTTDLPLSGYHIPAGTKMLLNYNMLTKDEQFYPQSQEFIPERWLRGSNSKKVNPFTFMPFGFGARMCIGKRIVDLEVEMIVATVIRNYYVEYNYPVDNPFRTYFVVVPNIPLTFKFRDVEY